MPFTVYPEYASRTIELHLGQDDFTSAKGNEAFP